MIKNQLYPYIEKYINEYLFGFTKEQLNVGVMNGLIVLDNLNIRPDRVNSKLDILDIPIWLKAGQIGKIQMCCSLMNFLGEKPLEVTINDIDLIIGPSLKWIIKNKPTFIEENEFHIADPYDEMDNNSHNIFTRKVNIYDSSIIKQKKKVYEILSDKSKLSEIINKIFTKCLTFYYNKAYLINIKINNINIRFEDDLFLNNECDLGLGIKIDSLLLNLSAEGVSKKNSFKCDNLNLYWEPKAKILIPCKKFMDSLDRDNNIDDGYYDYLKIIKIRNLDKHVNEIKIIENFNCMGNFGIAVIESGGLDFFSKNREKNFKMFIQLATAELNMNVYPDIITIITRIIDFTKSFFILEPIQDFKPMRKPYNKLSAALNKVKNDPKFKNKRKLVVRDWLFYLIWFNRFKKAIYNSSFNNPLHDEFSKYFNICCLPGKETDTVSVSNTLNKNNNSQLNDSNIFRHSEKDRELNNQSTRRENVKGDDPNPDNINLIIITECLMKGINIKLHPKYLEQQENIICLKLSNIEFKSMICKEKFDFNFDIKNLIVSFLNSAQITKMFDNRIKEEILFSSKLNYLNTGATKYLDKVTDNESILESESVYSPGPNKNNISIFSMTQNEKIINQNNSKKIIFKNENMESSRDTSFLNKNHTTNFNNFNKPEKNVNLKRNKIISLLLHDGEQPQIQNFSNQEKNNLSKIINEYNKDLIREKKSTKITLKMDKENILTNRSSNTINENTKVNLNLIEFYPTRDHSSNPILNLHFSKVNSHSTSAENLFINLGFIRINLPDEYLINVTHLMSNYLSIKKLTSSLGDEKNKLSEFLNFRTKGKVNNLRCFLLERLKNNYPENKLIPKTNSDILDYMTYLNKNIQPTSLNSNNKYHLDQIFNLFDNKNIEINFTPQEIYFIFFNSNLDSDVGKVKLPNFKFNFTSNNQTKINHLNFLDMDVSFNDFKNLKFILQNVFTMVQDKLKLSSFMLEPVIKKILKEKSSKVKISVQDGERKIKKIINKKQLAHGSKKNKNIPNNIFNKNNFLEVISPVQKNIHSCPEKFNIDFNNLNEIDSNLEDEDLQATIPFEEEELTPSDSSNNSFSHTSEIVNLENSVENLWDENQGSFPQLKKKTNEEKIHKVLNFNPKASEEENPQQKKSGHVNLQLTNSGNINLWNININK